MTKNALKSAVDAHLSTTREALELLWDNINKGQQKQLLKRQEIQKLLDRYGVSHE